MMHRFWTTLACREDMMQIAKTPKMPRRGSTRMKWLVGVPSATY